jgi:hypothetical protein
MSEEKIGATFTAQVYKIESRKDGSCRITLEAGADAMDDIQLVQRVAVKRDLSFTVAMIPLKPNLVNK